MWATHPFGAVGIARLPVLAVPPLPTVISNAAVLFARMLGEVPNPLEMAGAVEEMIRFPAPSL